MALAIVEPVNRVLGARNSAAGDPLDVLRGARAQERVLLRGQVGRVDGVDVAVGGDVREQLGAVAGQYVDDPRGHIAGSKDLAQDRPRQRIGVARDGDDGVAGAHRRGQERDQRQQRALVGRDDRDHARGLGDREVVEGSRDGVVAAQDLRVLVGPAGVVDEAVDGGRDLGVGRVLA